MRKLFEPFMKKNCRRQIKKNLEKKQLSKENEISYMSNGKAIATQLISGLMKRNKMSQYFPKQYEPFAGETNVKTDLSNYVIKTDIKKLKKQQNLIQLA